MSVMCIPAQMCAAVLRRLANEALTQCLVNSQWNLPTVEYPKLFGIGNPTPVDNVALNLLQTSRELTAASTVRGLSRSLKSNHFSIFKGEEITC